MTKPTTKPPAERRLRKEIRPLLQAYKAGKFTEDQAVREFLALIDDEVRRTRMSMPVIVEKCVEIDEGTAAKIAFGRYSLGYDPGVSRTAYLVR